MEYIKKILLNISAGTLALIISLVCPAAAYILSSDGGVVFIIWLVQTAVFSLLCIFMLRKIFKDWIWLIIVFSSVIIIAPVFTSNINYIALRILPKKRIELDINNFKGRNNSANSYYMISGSRLMLSRELSYYHEERYSVESRTSGRTEQKASKTEYHFIPLYWISDKTEKGFGVVEYNDQLKNELKKQNYDYLETDPDKVLKFYLIPGYKNLYNAADLAFRENASKSSPVDLEYNYMAFKNLFFSDENMIKYINERSSFSLIFMLVLWAVFILIPAIFLSRKKT
jgi:hypothetical protein